jgi:hypothetical protein
MSGTPQGQVRPVARSEGLVIEELDGEVLVYDTERDRAHCLNGLAAAVWSACDGRRGQRELTAYVVGSFPGCDEAAIAEAITQLDEGHLLEEVDGRRISRRRVLRTIGVGVAAGIAIPIVTSIVAPTPAHAFSCVPTGGSCGSSAQCCSGVCFGGFCL